MKAPVKVIDDYMQFINEGLTNCLLDQTDFLVIGCLGLQGVGKSTLMSNIANKYILLYIYIIIFYFII
jgi:protein SMG9